VLKRWTLKVTPLTGSAGPACRSAAWLVEVIAYS
jgi:hypothetical protein